MLGEKRKRGLLHGWIDMYYIKSKMRDFNYHTNPEYGKEALGHFSGWPYMKEIHSLTFWKFWSSLPGRY